MRDWSARNKDKVAASKSAKWRQQTPEQREARNAYLREYMRTHPEQRQKANERRRGYRSDPEYRRAEREQLYVAWKRDPGKRASIDRKSLLKNKYGMSLADFDAMLEAQGGCCAICGREQVGMRMHIDHCHDSGIVRGILCSNCNTGLGMFNDDPIRMLIAIDYLQAGGDPPG